MQPLFAFIEGLFSPGHMLIIGIIAILLFGKRLPEVARSLGKGIVEFKKGMKGLEDDFEGTVSRQEPRAAIEPPRPPQRVPTTAPKFEDNAGTISTPPQQG